jgi:translocation and assembly module TamB
MAYGQVLNIERGQLNFSGPVDNPGLNILALRQNLAVRAGVEIRGNVLNPTVKLVSIPEVSDSDKLSWLVLGHGIDQAGQDQFAMLSLAAGALLSQGQSVPLQTRFARAAGLDSFNVGGSSAESTSISLGKRLASNLYLTYEKEVTGLLNVARLTYDITSRWSIRTQAGSESAVDLLYTFSFK